MNIRTGFGYDVHALKEGEDFVLGGVKVDYEKGSFGHSDADVLIHAICDALLGAANLGDIGSHFPPSDPSYKGIDSKILLKKVLNLLDDNSFLVGNIDTTVVLQEPKIAKYIPKMKNCLSEVLEISIEDISIKATTTEHLGFIGRGKAIAAYANVLIYKK